MILVYQNKETDVLDGEDLCRGRVQTPLHALVVNDTPAHVDTVLGICLHIGEYHQKLISVGRIKVFLNASLELLPF